MRRVWNLTGFRCELDIRGAGGGAGAGELVKLAVHEFQHEGSGGCTEPRVSETHAAGFSQISCAWLLSFARDGAVFLDRGFADHVELIGRETGRHAEQFAIDELVQQQFGFHTGDGWRIVFRRQIDAGMDDAGLLMPRLAAKRRFVCAPGGIGAERQPRAAFAAAIVLSSELFERHAEPIALELEKQFVSAIGRAAGPFLRGP